MAPIYLLMALVLLTALAVVVDRIGRKKSAIRFRRLALKHQMHYSQRDSLGLTPRVAASFPIPGAGAVRVIDLLYQSDAHSHHYVFTAEYTIGVIGAKVRTRRAAAFSESKVDSLASPTVMLASADVALPAQYERLLDLTGDASSLPRPRPTA